jgi:hypothetical protein
MPTYPAPAPTISGDVETINRFLNEPTSVNRRVRDISLNRYLTDFIFPGRIEAAGGAILYEISEGIFLGQGPRGRQPRCPVPPLDRGPRSRRGRRGQEVGRGRPPDRRGHRPAQGDGARAHPAQAVQHDDPKVDSLALAAASAAITMSQTETAAWSSANADPFLDVMLADAQIAALDEGFEPDTLILTDVLYARMVSNQKVINGLARESSNNVTADGEVLSIAGKSIVRTNRMPAGIDRLLIDREQFGALGYENIPSPEYEGDPANGIETWARRDPQANDQWLIRGRRPVVPIVLEPNAGIEITA